MATWFNTTSGVTAFATSGMAVSLVGPRFPGSGTLIRPVIGTGGDLTFPAGTSVRCGVWARRRKQVLAEGELFEVTAMGFLPSGTDVARRDRLELANGQPGGPARYEVLTVIPAVDDMGRENHVAVELRDAAEPLGS